MPLPLGGDSRLSRRLALSLACLPACLQGVVPADAGRGVALVPEPSLPSRTFRQLPRRLYQLGPTDWASGEAGKFRSVELIRNVSTGWTRLAASPGRVGGAWAPPGSPSPGPVDLGTNPEPSVISKA